MRDDYDIDVESPRRIRYDGLRRVSYSLLVRYLKDQSLYIKYISCVVSHARMYIKSIPLTN